MSVKGVRALQFGDQSRAAIPRRCGRRSHVEIAKMDSQGVADVALDRRAGDRPHRASIRRVGFIEVPWVDLAIIRRPPVRGIATQDQCVGGDRPIDPRRAGHSGHRRVHYHQPQWAHG